MEDILEYPCEFVEHIENHATMYKAAKNISELMDILDLDDSLGENQIKMINDVLTRFDNYVAKLESYPNHGVA